VFSPCCNSDIDVSCYSLCWKFLYPFFGCRLLFSVAHPDPDPHVLGLPDPDPLVRGMDPDPALDPDPDPSIIMQK
jgi:hypothetical protein